MLYTPLYLLLQEGGDGIIARQGIDSRDTLDHPSDHLAGSTCRGFGFDGAFQTERSTKGQTEERAVVQCQDVDCLAFFCEEHRQV